MTTTVSTSAESLVEKLGELLRKVTIVKTLFPSSSVILPEAEPLSLFYHKFKCLPSEESAKFVLKLLELEHRLLDSILAHVPVLMSHAPRFFYTVSSGLTGMSVDIGPYEVAFVYEIGPKLYLGLSFSLPIPDQLYQEFPWLKWLKKSRLYREVSISVSPGNLPLITYSAEFERQLKEGLSRSYRSKISYKMLSEVVRRLFDIYQSDERYRLLDMLYRQAHDIVLRTTQELSRLNL